MKSIFPSQSRPNVRFAEVHLQHRQDGFILVVVLAAVLALSALLFGFNQTARISLAKTESFHRTEQARNAAWGGLQVALAVVRDANSPGSDRWAGQPPTSRITLPVGDANCAVTITPENGLLNVNRLQVPDDRLARRRIDQFLRLIDLVNRRHRDLPPIGYGVVPALIDWVDDDDEVTILDFVQRDNTGAENDYYQTCTPPYACRNGPLDAVDELLYVKGMTLENLARLRPFLTCVGDGQIDLNAAPRMILESLSEQIDPALAEMILRQRELRPFTTLAQLRSIPGMTDGICRDIQGLVTLTPAQRFYRITSHGRFGEHKCTIEALLQRNPQARTVDIVQYRE
ncbi:MAG: general secretion pathway protein GspK [Planctomycetes bacterium]|jgi:general secretion pathway protein K|nr:general secretion pathway protein GspK [Planctomycetota bacterium]